MTTGRSHQPIQLIINNIPVIIKTRRAGRRIAISVSPFKNVIVNAPRHMGIDEIEKFLKEKSDWISSQSARMKLIENESQLINATATRLDIKTSRAKLIKRIYELAAIHGFHYNGISIRTQKTLWGSCTAKNHINLNLRLAWLPQELMDYVILHELTHTRIKNHSRTFWNDLEKLTGNTKPLKEKLKITVICIAPRL